MFYSPIAFSKDFSEVLVSYMEEIAPGTKSNRTMWMSFEEFASYVPDVLVKYNNCGGRYSEKVSKLKYLEEIKSLPVGITYYPAS